MYAYKLQQRLAQNLMVTSWTALVLTSDLDNALITLTDYKSGLPNIQLSRLY